VLDLVCMLLERQRDTKDIQYVELRAPVESPRAGSLQTAGLFVAPCGCGTGAVCYWSAMQ
jgi:hypothetical protein